MFLIKQILKYFPLSARLQFGELNGDTVGGAGGGEDVVVVVAFLSLCVAASQALSIILHALFLLRFSLIIFCRPGVCSGKGVAWGRGKVVQTCTWKGVFALDPKPANSKKQTTKAASKVHRLLLLLLVLVRFSFFFLLFITLWVP